MQIGHGDYTFREHQVQVKYYETLQYKSINTRFQMHYIKKLNSVPYIYLCSSYRLLRNRFK